MNDLISRQAAIDAFSVGKELLSRVLDDMDVVGADREKYSWGLGLIEASIKDIEELPPAQPEPHEGHWIGSDGSYICSECNGSPLDFIDTMGASFDAYVETPMKFCPNCGAKMKGDSK